MPIPMPPPPAPFVAPDLHPVVARPSAHLTFFRDRRGVLRPGNGSLRHGLWIAAEDGPLEVRFHKRADGTVWGEQALYVDGDRADGIARASAAARTEQLAPRMVGGMQQLRAFVRYSIRTRRGALLRTWIVGQCGSPSGPSRLNREGSPDDPTYFGGWDDSCGAEGGYVLGRALGLDRGWAMQPSTTLGKLRPLRPGRYRLHMQVNPLRGLAATNPRNDTTSVPLFVTHANTRRFDEDDEFLDDEAVPTVDWEMRSRAVEPDWYANQLRRVEAIAEGRTSTGSGRAGKPSPAPEDVDLPDLRSAPSFEIRTSRGRSRRDMLDFGALTWNAGPGVLEVEAFRETGTVLDAYQVFHRDGERATRQRRGTLLWHAAPGHDHFHFSAFAHYQLTRMDGRVVRDSGKHSWCIVDTDLVDNSLPGAGFSGFGFGGGGCGSESGSLWARMSMSVGSGDFYGGGIAGQSFDISTLPNGLYKIRLEANPARVLAEANYRNNVSNRIVRLAGPKGNRRVIPRPNPLVNDRGGCFDCDFSDDFNS